MYHYPAFYLLSRFSIHIPQVDQVTYMFHELTHFDAIYSPCTVDHEYMYIRVLGLNATRALNNLQSYAFYAKDLRLARGKDYLVLSRSPPSPSSRAYMTDSESDDQGTERRETTRTTA